MRCTILRTALAASVALLLLALVPSVRAQTTSGYLSDNVTFIDPDRGPNLDPGPEDPDVGDEDIELLAPEDEDEDEDEPDEVPPAVPGGDDGGSASDVLQKLPTAYPYTLARAIRDMMIRTPGRRWEFVLSYEDIQYRDITGNSWLVVAGHERTYSPWGWGILVPMQRWELDGFDSFWQVGIAPYAFVVLKDVLRIGAFGAIDRSFSDIPELGDETSWATGVFASAPLKLGDRVTLTPVGVYEYYWNGQDILSDSSLFTVGPRFDVSLSKSVAIGLFGFYTSEMENDQIDDSYWEYGVVLNIAIKETWGLSFGYQGIEDAENLDYDKYFLGAHLNF